MGGWGMARETAVPFRTQVGKGLGRLDWPRSPPNSPSFPSSLPCHHHQRLGGWVDRLTLPGSSLLPLRSSPGPSPWHDAVSPPLPLFFLPEEPATSQDTWLLLGLVPTPRRHPGELTSPTLWQRMELPSFQEHIQNSLEIREKWPR